jgi:predicted PurR-regulated permease PerM
MGMLSDPGPRRAPSSRVVVALLSVIAVILVVSALRATYFVTMPLAFAFFTTILVWPVHQWLHRRLPARFGWVATALVLLGIMWVMGAFLATAAIIVYTITATGPINSWTNGVGAGKPSLHGFGSRGFPCRAKRAASRSQGISQSGPGGPPSPSRGLPRSSYSWSSSRC